jgi:radical SAM-linked protein
LQQIETLRRALEKSNWPTSKSGGKRPKAKVSFGPAISVGYESMCEYCDVELNSRLDMKTGKEELQRHLPDGYMVMEVKSIPRFFPSLENSLNAVRYEVRSALLVGKESDWEKFWSEKCFIVTKKKESGDVAIDARPLVKSWKLTGDQLELVLRFGPGRTLKPERILQSVCNLSDDDVAMGTPTSKCLVKRTNMYFEKQNGELAEL